MTNISSAVEMRKVINLLNQATKSYDLGSSIMSDKEWDSYYFALVEAEKNLGIIYPDSPTQKVIYSIESELHKVTHNHPMLSLNKTKDLEEIKEFMTREAVITMCKVDGLTCSLLYEDGALVRAETRGNGEVGEDITHNARVIPSIPQRINCKDRVIVDGEIVCLYKDFEKFSSEYKNPRNFAAGSIRLLDARECGSRNLTFIAWDMIEGCNMPFLSNKLSELKRYGFFTVPWTLASIKKVEEGIEALKQEAKDLSIPIDGLVFKYDPTGFYESLGTTNHHFRGGLAYKFYDETYSTTLTNIEWTMGRTGVLTPVATFEPVDIDGSIVERASMHNVSIMTELLGSHPNKGQKINIYKANMIIPQIYDSDKENVNSDSIIPIPTICPICGSPTTLSTNNNTTNLLCTNDDCEGKLINKLDHFCGKKGLDIKGLSKMTLDKLIEWGWVDSPISIFHLSEHQKEWQTKPGFGIKSVNNLLNAIAAAATPTLEQFLSALGIPLIGRTYAKKICEYFSTYEDFRNAIVDGFDFASIEGFGPQMHEAIISFDYYYGDRLYNMKLVTIKNSQMETVSNNDFNGLTFVITGKLKTFKNRDQIAELITNRGGKVSNSVTSKTTYLINNDINSASTKNQTAKKLGVKIITEEDFLKL